MIQKIEQNLIKELSPLITKELIYEKNTIIFNQDTYLKNILILLDGTIKLTHIIPSGKELTLGVYSAKRIVLSNFFNNHKNFISLFRIQTLNTCKIGIVPFKNFKFNEDLNMELIKYYDSLFQQIYLQMRDLVFHNNSCKLMSIFIRLANSYGIKVSNGIKINMELSNITLSEYTGCAPETISRLVKDLILMNIVEKKENIFTIKNIDFMKSKLNCSYCRNELCEI